MTLWLVERGGRDGEQVEVISSPVAKIKARQGGPSAEKKRLLTIEKFALRTSDHAAETRPRSRSQPTKTKAAPSEDYHDQSSREDSRRELCA